MKRVIATMLLISSTLWAEPPNPTPSIPNAGICLPPNVAGPQLPSCFIHPAPAQLTGPHSGSGSGIGATPILISAAAPIITYFVVRQIRRHRSSNRQPK